MFIKKIILIISVIFCITIPGITHAENNISEQVQNIVQKVIDAKESKELNAGIINILSVNHLNRFLGFIENGNIDAIIQNEHFLYTYLYLQAQDIVYVQVLEQDFYVSLKLEKIDGTLYLEGNKMVYDLVGEKIQLAKYNPLLGEKSILPDGAPIINYNEISVLHYFPAFNVLKNDILERVEKIEQESSTAFVNTIEAFEFADENLQDLVIPFYALQHSYPRNEYRAVQILFSKKVNLFYVELYSRPVLFEKIKTIYDAKNLWGNTEEKKKLIEKVYKYFIDNGMLLSEKEKQELYMINETLGDFSNIYASNIAQSRKQRTVFIPKEELLEGLPKYVIDNAKNQANIYGKNGWYFPLTTSNYFDVMKYAEDREVRKAMYKAFHLVANYGEGKRMDNQEVLKNIIAYRQAKAHLLGYENYTDYVLESRMIKNEDEVLSFLDNTRDASMKKAKQEILELEQFKKEHLKGDDLENMERWDVEYFRNLQKEELFQVDMKKLMEYFELGNVMDGVFLHAKKLYGLEFVYNKDIPTYHPDVTPYQVFDKVGNYLGLVYIDLYTRAGKKNSSWTQVFRYQGKTFEYEDKRPIVGFHMDIVKPGRNQKTLLSFGQVQTLFHEFGHLMHMVLSDVNYPSLSCTNVPWDFVEVPSQFNEKWLYEKEVLKTFAKHYETGEIMPTFYMDMLLELQEYHQGYFLSRQIAISELDIRWHTLEVNEASIPNISVKDFEKSIFEQYRLFEYDDQILFSTHFDHIFAGGYASGYYSYDWSRAISELLWDRLFKKDIYNQFSVQKYKDIIDDLGTKNNSKQTLLWMLGEEEIDLKPYYRANGL